MTTKVMETQLNNLASEMVMLRSVIIGFLGDNDPEGEYRPEFVEKILQLSRKKQESVVYTNSDDFLKLIKQLYANYT